MPRAGGGVVLQGLYLGSMAQICVSAAAKCAQNWFKINKNPILAPATLQQAPAAAQLKNLKPKPFLGSFSKPPQTPNCAE